MAIRKYCDRHKPWDVRAEAASPSGFKLGRDGLPKPGQVYVRERDERWIRASEVAAILAETPEARVRAVVCQLRKQYVTYADYWTVSEWLKVNDEAITAGNFERPSVEEDGTADNYEAQIESILGRERERESQVRGIGGCMQS